MKNKKHKALFIKPGDVVKNRIWDMHHFILELSCYKGFDIFFITDNFEFDHNEHVTVFPGYPGLQKSIDIFFVYFKRLQNLIAVIKKVKPDIIHINNHMGALECLLCARLLRPSAKVILDIRTLPDKRYKYFYYRLITPFFHWVFALNDTIKKKMVKNSQNSLLPLGFDSDIFGPPNSPRTQYCARTPLKCLYYGSLDKKRKLDLMVKGFIVAIKSGCEIFLTIIGTGNARDELVKEVNNSQLQDVITLTSFRPQNQLVEIIRNHDLGISFIPNEGMYVPQVPLKTVEMLACGIPVMATGTLGNKEIIDNFVNGFIIPDTVEGVAHSLRDIWGNGIPNKMYRRAIPSVSHLTWKSLNKRYLIKVYERLLGISS
jgi:glycosyltransferase involved in cell wall biosynthesis